MDWTKLRFVHFCLLWSIIHILQPKKIHVWFISVTYASLNSPPPITETFGTLIPTTANGFFFKAVNLSTAHPYFQHCWKSSHGPMSHDQNKDVSWDVVSTPPSNILIYIRSKCRRLCPPPSCCVSGNMCLEHVCCLLHDSTYCILLSCENFKCLSWLLILHIVVPCLIMTCHYPQILLLECFCQPWRDTMAWEDHVQRQEQAQGSSQAEFCHYAGGCKKHYEGHTSQIWP